MGELAAIAGTTMSLQSMIEDGQVVLSSTEHDALVQVDMAVLKP